VQPLLAPKVIKQRAAVETKSPFQLVSEYEPAGDQPVAIQTLMEGIQAGEKDQVLLGVTGSGKT